MTKDKIEIGDIRDSTKWGKFKVIDKCGKIVAVEFQDTGYITLSCTTHVKSGIVRDRLKPSIFGVGISGEAKQVGDNRYQFDYDVWSNMLNRCYNTNYHKHKPCYIGCTVSDDFKYFEKFRDWFKQQKCYDDTTCTLDKDILSNGGKHYSAETCCFVPTSVNNVVVGMRSKITCGLPVGVRRTESGRFIAAISNKRIGTYNTKEEAFEAYCKVKLEKIRTVAEKFKDSLDIVVYNKLINFEVLYV